METKINKASHINECKTLKKSESGGIVYSTEQGNDHGREYIHFNGHIGPDGRELKRFGAWIEKSYGAGVYLEVFHDTINGRRNKQTVELGKDDVIRMIKFLQGLVDSGQLRNYHTDKCENFDGIGENK